MNKPLPTRQPAPMPQLSLTPSAPVTNPAGARRRGPPRAQRTRGAMRSRHVEAHAVAWLRSLRDEARVAS